MKLWETFNVQKQEDISYYNTSKGFETEDFAIHLNRLIRKEMAAKGKDGIMFLCISTGRSAGDSLDPLVGHMPRSRWLRGAAVIGTFDKPVHAMNLDLYARYIRLHYPDYVVAVIDVSAGSLDHVGYVTLGRGVFQPGLGVSKELQAVGDMAIIGTVGGMGSRDPVMLQSVRLSMVTKMADCICESIFLVERLWENVAVIRQILRRESAMLAQIKNSEVILWENCMNPSPSCRRISGKQVRGTRS